MVLDSISPLVLLSHQSDKPSLGPRPVPVTLAAPGLFTGVDQLTNLADFFPGGLIQFIHPPFDEKYWGTFGIPARVRVDLWGAEATRGLAYRDTGAAVAAGTPGVRRSISAGRKARGMASDGYKGGAD